MSTNSRTDPDAFVKLTAFEQGWVVGFLEGEGSFHLQKASRLGDLRYPRISASQKQREPLERLVATLGGGIYRSTYGGSKATVPGIWAWCLDGKGVSGVALSMRPFMSPRRQEQIDAMVSGEVRRPAVGEGNTGAILTEEIVRTIRASSETQRVLAERYGVSLSTISRAKTGDNWAHV